MKFQRQRRRRVRLLTPMRGGETMDSDVTLCGAGDGVSTGEQHGSPLSVADRKVLSMTLIDLNDNANRSPLLKHKLTPDDMENDNEVSSLDRSQRFPSLDTSTASGLYFYDEDFNETNDFNDHYDYQNEIGNDSFFYGQKLARTKSDTCLYELDLSMSERASSQGQSSCGYDAASSADLSLHSDQFSPCGSRPESGAKLFSSISAADKHLYSTDSLDHDLNSSVLQDDFDLAACNAKKENYMLAFDRSPVRFSDEDDPYGDAWLSDARDNVEECDVPSDSECNSELGEVEEDAGEVVYLSGDYVSNDQEPLLGMFVSNASEAMADDTGRSDARILADVSEILVDLTEESSNSTTPVVEAPVEDSGCKSATTPSTLPSPSLGTGPNSTLDDYGSEILGELEPDLRTSADAYTSYAYDNIFFEAIQHPVPEARPSRAIVSSAPVTGNLMIFSGEEEQLATLSEGDKEPKQRFLKRWSNYEGLNEVKMTNLATFATIKHQKEKLEPAMNTSSMRTSQSIESLPSESKTSSSTKMTTWQQMKKSRAPQTSWKKICQMKEIMKAEDSIYQDASKAKSVPNLSEMCRSMDKSVEVKRRENKEERDPSKRHSFTLFEIFRRAKSEEEEPQRMIPSPVYQRMFASLMKSAESEVGSFYLDNTQAVKKKTDDGKQSLVKSSEDSTSSKNCAVQTSFHDEATTKSVQTSTPPQVLRRYYSSLDISQRGHLVSMTRSTSDMGLSGRAVSSSPSKHLTNSMLFSRGHLPDLSFLNRPFIKEKPHRHKDKPRSDVDHRRDQSRLGKSQNSLIIHKKHQSPKRLHNPQIRQLRQIDDSNPETADEIDVPPRKPKRTFAFEASQDAHTSEAIPLRRLVPRSSSCESARSSSYHSSCMDQSSASHRSQSLDNAHYCQQRRSHSGSRSSSGSETRSDVSRMSVDSDLASSHRSDSSSGSKRLKSCLTKRRRSSRSNSPAARSRRRHSTSYYESYTEDAPHSWDQYDHSLLHRDNSQCACPQCHPPCCHGYRERRRHCRLSYPPCHAHRQCCCHGGGDASCYDNCGCYDDYNGCHSSQQYSGRCSYQSGSDDGKKKTVSFNEEIRYHSPRNSPFASPKHHAVVEGCRVLKSPPLRAMEQRTCDRMTTCGPRRQSESSSVDSAFESESPPREFMISPTKLTLAEHDDDASDTSVQSKTGLIDDLFRAVDYVQQHFAGAIDMREKSHLGTSADCPKIGSLLLTQLCPALYNLLGNGLRLRVRSFFGQVKNNVWKMVEESAELAPSMPVLSDIVKEVRSQLYVRNSSAKFNAFIFGLLNAKALDHWLQLLRTQVKLVRKHYDTDAILHIFTTVRGRHLFNDCMRALRPLASLPFRIECNLEYKYRSTFSDCSTPELPLTKSQDSEGLPELFEKTDVRQYIQQARDWIEGSKLSESAMDYLGQRFYREFGQFSQNKKANRWSLPPVETMISLANFFAKSPTEKPSPSLEEFALYLARVNQSVSDDSDKERSEREKSYSRIEKIIQNGDFHRKLDRDDDMESERGAFGCSYRQTDYQFENRFQRVESEPLFSEAHTGAIPKRNSLPEVSRAGMDQSQKRWSFGSSLINVFDKLLLDQSKTGEKGQEKPSQDVPKNVQKMADLPKNMQRQDSPKNMQYSQTGKQEDEDTPTPKASPIRTWKSVAESSGQVSPKQSMTTASGAEATPTSAGATPSSPLRTWKTVASPKSSFEGQDFSTPPEEAEDVNANTVPSPVTDQRQTPQQDQQNQQPDTDLPAVRPNNLLIRHFNAPRSSSSCSGRLCRSQKGRRQHNPAKQYVQAVCNHVASNTDQLSFKKGDMMLVVRDFERDWFYCTRANKTGLVHKICVQRIWDPCDSY